MHVLQTALHTAQDPIDHTGGPGVLAVGLYQRHGAVHRSTVGNTGEEQHLIGPQAQGLDHLSLHPLQRDIGEFSQIKVQQHLILQYAKAELGGKRRIPAGERRRRELFLQRSVRPSPLPLTGVQSQHGRFPCIHSGSSSRFSSLTSVDGNGVAPEIVRRCHPSAARGLQF